MDKMVIAMPVTANTTTYRKALKAVAASHGHNIGSFVADLIAKYHGTEVSDYMRSFSGDDGYISEQVDTFGEKSA